ncbi:Hypothetical protein BPA_0031200 (plasmid) [Borrelia parkeri SLO]|uniref:Uncharacterized protein n=1 Tax=Borrelia parkeri SLO TaxID=1313294 RepID=W5SS67_BORPR|nr:hypothetical protein [Borrelia parkeri]AHH10044.1 Hypothetical protein BPA_0031200 [Borrelia parkeri SLO]UPA11037.1 hypothetical protein bpSLO_000888 [Borrelia parkeri]UPA11111.1 hypothetical protein bpSLO_000929 [Borrelia parkeri]UPA11132.1 hypothetical protein bpSLO_001013 [Borrelia parkeri]UPA11170.1 hypothetical protein bpSLO_000971 [Borrelia parkeri]
MEVEIGWFDKRNAKIASLHEMGSSKLPLRSHLYAVADNYKFREYINTPYIKACFLQSPKKGMQAIAEAFITYYTNYVISGKVKPSLSSKTIASKRDKGSPHPEVALVDTGEMINSISYRINE